MNKTIIKAFVEDYFKLNNIDFTIDSNGIYTVTLKDVLANHLGKQRKFCFNREIADDYGVDYLSLNNDFMKYVLRDSTKNGQLLKAKLTLSPLIKKDLKFEKGIKVKAQTIINDIAIGFLFKISSNDTISNTPEMLKYEVIGYNNGYIFPEEITEEFHNLEFESTNIKFSSKDITKAHTIAYEHIIQYIESKYNEHENANKSKYAERIEELKQRHEDILNSCKQEEKLKEEKIKEWAYRTEHARTYDVQRKYRDEKLKAESALFNLKQENLKKIESDFIRTERLIKEEESNYNFEIKLQLLSAIIFEYGIIDYKLLSTLNNEECEVSYNLVTNKIEHYACPTCQKEANELHLSKSGHFCCPNCSVYSAEKDEYYCNKDNVDKCQISGNHIPREEEYRCDACNKYFEKQFLNKDILGKQVCTICGKKTKDGKLINKNDGIFSKKYNSHFKPTDVKLCEFSKEYYPNDEVELATGTNQIIAKEFIKLCKSTKLTFSPKEMINEKISGLAGNMRKLNKEEIKYAALKEKVKGKNIEFNENKYWALIKLKGIIKSKYLLYNKSKKKIVETK